MEHSILHTQKLSIGYSTHKPIKTGIDIDLLSGRLTALLGKNGSGKSTLIRTLAGFLNSEKHSIIIDGKDLHSYSQAELSRKMSVVLTEILGDIQYLRVREVVEMGRYPYCDCFAALSEQDHQEVRKAMQIVGIEHIAEQSMARISDGQRQKVMIAKALAQNTDIIIMDEPLSFLDTPSKVDIMLTVQRLAVEQGKTILISSHDVDLAYHFAHRLWLMDCEHSIIQTDTDKTSKIDVVSYIFGEQADAIIDYISI